MNNTMPNEYEIEKLAVKHEAFGFGVADGKGYTTHGFDPDGLESFVSELRDRWSANTLLSEPARVPLRDEQIEALPVWKHFVSLSPETRAAITRAIEAAHGISSTERML